MYNFRFASFVEGNSHLSDDEIVDYEAYAFSMDRKEKRGPLANSTSAMEISDDDEISSDDENWRFNQSSEHREKWSVEIEPNVAWNNRWQDRF